MKKLFLLLIICTGLLWVIPARALDVSITTTLQDAIDAAGITDYNQVTELKILSGTLNAVDFTLIRNNLRYLRVLDMENASVAGNAIPQNAFQSCYNLTSVTLPGSVTSIGDWAFSGCTNLTQIIVANGNTAYTSENGVLFNSDKTELIIYPRGRTEQNYTIPSTVTSIGSNAFSGCSQLISITIPEGVTHIRNGAFYSCSGLTSINIPESVTTIGEQAFSSCTGLTSVTLPESVTTITNNAFSGCTALTSVTITTSVTNIASNAFAGCNDLTFTIIPGSTSSIADNAFYNNEGLSSVIISEGITEIGNSAFYYCRNLTSITIPGSVTTIGERAFSSCTGLTSVSISEGVTSIGHSAFSSCTGLPSITIPESVTTIGNYAFSYCTGLTSVTIPKNVISIGDYIFSRCSNLTRIEVAGDNPAYVSEDGVLFNFDKTHLIQYLPSKSGQSYTIPSTVTAIGNGAFSNCTALTSVAIPEGVTSIGRSAFSGCSNLTSASLPESVTTIGNNAFSSCSNLTSIVIPEGVTDIREGVFSGCRSLTVISIPENMTTIGSNAFNYCTGLISLTIPGSVTRIDESAFISCTGLTSLTIMEGESLRVGERAFSGCRSLTTVTFPESVVTVSDQAFESCDGLTSFYTYREQPAAISQDAFSKTDLSNCTLYVPAGSKTTYLSTAGWSVFDRIVEMDEINPVTGICLNKEETVLMEGNTETLTATVEPEDATNKTVSWESSNTDIARVDQSGKVTAVSAGKAVITATAGKGKFSAVCIVTVEPEGPSVTGITLSQSSLNMFGGHTATLVAVIEPADAVNKTVTWSSSNPAAVTVDQEGNLTAIQAGEAVIVAIVGKFSAVCTVSVWQTVEGTVKDEDGTALSGKVMFYPVELKAGEKITPGDAIPAGGLSFTGGSFSYDLPAGQYLVQALPAIEEYLPGYYHDRDDQPSPAAWMDAVLVEIPSENLFLSIQPARVNTPEPEPDEETIVIEGTVEADGSLTGSSVLKAGNPVAGVSLVLYGKPAGSTGTYTAVAATQTGADGQFSFGEVPAGYEYYLTADLPGFTMETPAVIPVEEGKSVYKVNCTVDVNAQTITTQVTAETPTGFKTPAKPLAALYPNPTDGLFILNFEAEDTYRITITTLTGKVMSQQMITGQMQQMDISSYPAGVYLVIIDNGAERSTVKIIKKLLISFNQVLL